ncbi:MAG: energy transducer TonB [Myxococcales bacterium]|nr:energy transducer TonB [Myxococcales bacterium]
MREYKDRWIIGVSVGLSILVHLIIIAVFFSGIVDLSPRGKGDETIDFDLSQADAKALEELARQEQKPDRMLFQKEQPSEKAPTKADAYGFQNHEAERPTHLADKPINEIERDVGPRGPGQGAGRPSQSGGRMPPMPKVGEGVGEKPDNKAFDPSGERIEKGKPPTNLDQMLAKTGMQAPRGGGGGEDGINPYNPNVGDPGKVLSISTKELKYMGYFSHMREKIYLAWVYPQDSQRRGEQGSCLLKFTVQRSGEVSEARILETSGYRLLDQYAVKAVREAHFNPIPANWPEKELTVAARFNYMLVGSGYIQ